MPCVLRSLMMSMATAQIVCDRGDPPAISIHNLCPSMSLFNLETGFDFFLIILHSHTVAARHKSRKRQGCIAGMRSTCWTLRSTRAAHSFRLDALVYSIQLLHGAGTVHRIKNIDAGARALCAFIVRVRVRIVRVRACCRGLAPCPRVTGAAGAQAGPCLGLCRRGCCAPPRAWVQVLPALCGQAPGACVAHCLRVVDIAGEVIQQLGARRHLTATRAAS